MQTVYTIENIKILIMCKYGILNTTIGNAIGIILANK